MFPATIWSARSRFRRARRRLPTAPTVTALLLKQHLNFVYNHYFERKEVLIELLFVSLTSVTPLVYTNPLYPPFVLKAMKGLVQPSEV